MFRKYQFNLTVTGLGETVDDAFEDALVSLKDDPESAITNEVVYVLVDEDENEDDQEEYIE